MTDHDIPRDRHGRPLIKDGDKLIPYQRTSSFGSVLEDTYQLAKWQQRNVALGLTVDPALYGLVAATRSTETARLDYLCEQAQEKAGSKEKAEYGTLVHAYAERVDRATSHDEVSFIIGEAPLNMQPDLWAYWKLMREYGPPVIAEEFTVCDELGVAGTPDQIRKVGRVKVVDLKSGNIKYGMVKIAIQLAVYAHSVLYDWKTETRTPYPVDVDLNEAIVIHLPAGKGTAELITVDIKEGWERAKLAKKVLEARSVAGLSRKFVA